MKTTSRSLLNIIKNYKLSVFLNLIGLCIAFVAFLLLALQIRYEWTYDAFHKNAKQIYRLGVLFPDKGASALFARPLGDEFIKSSPHIQDGALIRNYVDNIEFSIHKKDEVFSFFADRRIVYPNYLNIFQFKMLEGSLDCLSAPDKIIIPASLASKLFDNESAIGQEIFLKKSTMTIGGVYSDLPENSVVKNYIYQSITNDMDLEKWRNMNYQVYLQLDDPKNASVVLDNFRKNFQDENYDWSRGELRLTNVQDIYYESDTSFDSQVEKGSKPILYIMITVALLIIIIASINFMNFYNAIIPMRLKSIIIQKVLGNSSFTLRISLLLEVLSITIIAYLLALIGISLLSKTAVTNLITPDISIEENLPFFTILISIPVIISILSGLYPSKTLTSYSLATVLKGSFARSGEGRMVRNILIGLQFFVSFILFITASFIYIQNKSMKNEDLGYDKNEIVIVQMNQELNQNRFTFENKLRQQSAIENVAFADVLFSSNDYYSGWSAKYEDRDISFQVLSVDANFLDVMGIAITDGRNFRSEDESMSDFSYIFNEVAHKTYEMKVGNKLTSTPIGDGVIVGFMKDAKFQSFRVQTEPMAFRLLRKSLPSVAFNYAYIRTKENVTSQEAINEIRQIAKSVSPNNVVDIIPFSNIIDDLYQSEDNISFIISLFSIVAVFISISGVFSLIAFDNQYRKKEICIRKVYGASLSSVIIQFNKTYLWITFISFCLASPLVYYGLTYWLQNFAYKTPLYNWVFALIFLIVSSIVSLIITTQIWHTANENPVNSLKAE